MSLREDAYCPACPDPETAFRIEDVGMKFETDGAFGCDDGVTFRVTRPAWEVVMMEHLRVEDDDAHHQLYAECVTAMAGRSVERTVQDSLQSVVDSVWRSMGDAFRQSGPETLDLRPQLFAGIPQRLAELSPWTDRINAFNRGVLEENR